MANSTGLDGDERYHYHYILGLVCLVLVGHFMFQVHAYPIPGFPITLTKDNEVADALGSRSLGFMSRWYVCIQLFHTYKDNLLRLPLMYP